MLLWLLRRRRREREIEEEGKEKIDVKQKVQDPH